MNMSNLGLPIHHSLNLQKSLLVTNKASLELQNPANLEANAISASFQHLNYHRDSSLDSFIPAHLTILSQQPHKQQKPQHIFTSSYQSNGGEKMIEPEAQDDSVFVIQTIQWESSDILEEFAAEEQINLNRPNPVFD